MNLPRLFASAVAMAVFIIFAGCVSAPRALSAEAKPGETIKWTMKVKPLDNMIDLYLTDARTGKPITKAKVAVVVTLPDGSKVEKELKGMKMGKKYSFMGSLDFPLKGVYVFDVDVKAGKKKAKFSFRYEVKH